MKIGYEAKRIFHNKSGLGNYGRDLIRSLSKYYPINEYYLYNPKKGKEILFSSENINTVEKLPFSLFHRLFKNIWRQKGVIKDLLKDNILIFHGLSGELPTGINKIKSVVTIHDLIFVRYPEYYSFFDRKIHLLKVSKAAKNADTIIAVSEQTKRDIIEFLGEDEHKIKVVYQTCHNAFKKTYSDKEKKEVCEKYNLPKKFLLNVGTIEERKNAKTIVKAIKDINISLVLIGKETKYTESIKKYIKNNSLEDRVMFFKNINTRELAIIYQLASIFIYPSVFEGFGIPIIEALYSKTPVITNENGVFPEVGGPDSIYVDPFNVKDLKNKINLILSDLSLKEKMIDNGFLFAQKFSNKNMADQTISIYQNLIKNK